MGKHYIAEDPNNRRWAEDVSGFGYQMLLKMGWSAGKGLGKQEDGRTSHIKASVRSDNRGVGAQVGSVDAVHTQRIDTFNGVLARLNRSHSQQSLSTTTTTTSDKEEEQENNNNNNNNNTLDVYVGRQRVLYGRRLHSFTAKRSAEDLRAIFGMEGNAVTSSSSDDSCETHNNNNNNNSDVSNAFCHSGRTLDAYFGRKRRYDDENDITKKENEKENVEDCCIPRKKRRRLNADNLDDEQKKKDKKKKKSKKEKKEKKEKKVKKDKKDKKDKKERRKKSKRAKQITDN